MRQSRWSRLSFIFSGGCVFSLEVKLEKNEILTFKFNLTLKVITPQTIVILAKVFSTSAQAWTGDESFLRQGRDWYIDTHTDTHTDIQMQAMTRTEGQNLPQIKIYQEAVGKWIGHIAVFYTIPFGWGLICQRHVRHFTVFKISAGPRTMTGKIWVGPASFRSLWYINFSKIVLWSSKSERERERLSLSAFWGTEDIGVHTVNISRVIITYTLE